MSNQPESSKNATSNFIVYWMQRIETLRIRKSFPRVVWKNQEFQKTPSDPGYISGYLLGLASYRVSKRFRCTALSVNRSGRVIPSTSTCSCSWSARRSAFASWKQVFFFEFHQFGWTTWRIIPLQLVHSLKLTVDLPILFGWLRLKPSMGRLHIYLYMNLVDLSGTM